MRLFLLGFPLILLMACSGGGDGGQDGILLLANKKETTIHNLWVDEHINRCLFPTDRDFICDRQLLIDMGGYRVHTDYHFEIKTGPQIYSYHGGVQYPGQKLDHAGFNKPYKSGIYGEPGGLAKEQYVLSADKTKLEIRWFYQEDGENQFKLMKTRTLVAFEQKNFEEIDRAINYLSLPGTWHSQREALFKKIEKRQAAVMVRIVPQTGIDLITKFGGSFPAKFKIRFSQEVVDALEAQEDYYLSVSFINGRLYPHDFYNFVVPACTIFKNDSRAKLVAAKEYEARADYPNKPRGYIEIDFGGDYPETQGFSFFCNREYDNDIVLTSDIEHALADHGEISFF